MIRDEKLAREAMPRVHRAPLTAIVLTFNSANSIGVVLDSLSGLASRVVVVDSFSTDRTREIAESKGAEIVEHPFENYSRQRRWAEGFAVVPGGQWLLHVDSDEVLTVELGASIGRALTRDDPDLDGYLIQRLSFFWGRPIRHGHMNPSWHLRLYRSGRGCCEDRLYDQHFVVEGRTEKLNGKLLDLQAVSLESWTASHNRWSSAEEREAGSGVENTSQERLRASLTGDRRERKRWLKERIWYRAPLLVRPFAFFVYSYFFKLGFLDGKVGLVYHILQAFWFRFLVDAKILEAREFGAVAANAPSPEWLSEHGARERQGTGHYVG